MLGLLSNTFDMFQAISEFIDAKSSSTADVSAFLRLGHFLNNCIKNELAKLFKKITIK